MDIRVVVAVPEDVEALVASVGGLFLEDGGRHDPSMSTDWPALEGTAYYTGLVGDARCLVLVARSGERTVGHLVGKLIEPDAMRTVRVAVLESMRVAPDNRGQGVGGLLVRRFFDWARERGAAEASVTAYAANSGAQRFYARHGFGPKSVTLRASV